MRLAFGIVSLFPWGGLQRDCMRLARAAAEKGHSVTIFTARTFGELPRDLDVRILPSRAITNGGRNRRFSKALGNAATGHFDRIVGFDKLPGLDILYCGDLCFADSHSNPLLKLTPRQRIMTGLEAACFARESATKILILSEPQREAYRTVWNTQADRFVMLPPPVDPDRRKPHLRNDGTRERVRNSLGIAPDEMLLLCIGAWSYRKGFDRAIAAAAKIDNARVVIVGTETDDAFLLKELASRHSRRIRNRISILGPRDDIAELIAAADLLIHVARSENTGTVILEAMINGLPVVASSVCGFAGYVTEADAGVVLPEPFNPDDLVKILRESTVERRAAWSANGVASGANTFLYGGVDTALSAIEEAPKRAPAIGAASGTMSIVITTYNRPDALDAVLRGLARQSDKRFEVIVADDGSTPRTAEVLDSWRKRLSQPLTHVWHEDRGFRAAEIRNRAIRASSSDYCIFLDGDCIPRHDFVAAHRHLAEPNWFVIGNRVLMSQRLTERVLTEHLHPEEWTFGDFLRERLSGNINRMAPLLHTKLEIARRALPQRWWGARSCNLAIWHSDLDRVDGFDGSYVGWGLEDSDLLIRLLRAGVQRKDGRFATGVFHLWHPLAEPSMLSANQPLLDSIQRSDRIRSIMGMSTLHGDEPGAASDVRQAQAAIA